MHNWEGNQFDPKEYLFFTVIAKCVTHQLAIADSL